MEKNIHLVLAIHLGTKHDVQKTWQQRKLTRKQTENATLVS